MSLGIIVMAIIIAITILVLIAVFYYGTQHDAHTEIRRAEASRAVQILKAQEEAAARKLATASGPAEAQAEDSEQH